MAGQAVNDPLLTKRAKRETIGFMSERYFCLDCQSRLPEEAAPYLTELVVGDDAGVPYNCSQCGAQLRPANDRIQGAS